MSRHVLVVRPDSLGDVLVCGPAVRAVAAAADRVTFWAGPRGAQAAALLPGVDDVLVWETPWISADAPPVRRTDVLDLVDGVRARGIDEALVLTSFHQSALPTALVLRLAGIPRISAVSEDYPGSLLDARLAAPGEAPEPQRMLAVAEAAGFPLPPGDDGALRIVPVRSDLDDAPSAVDGPYTVVHPGTDAPSRAYPHWGDVVGRLTSLGATVLVTGQAAETGLTAGVVAHARPPGRAVDLAGRCTLRELAAVLAGADVVLVGNTGPAHLAAAVGTPVVSLFAPTVPALRWAPYGPDVEVLGEQHAPCRDTRARECPVVGHPCLAGVDPADVVAAAVRRRREGVPA